MEPACGVAPITTFVVVLVVRVLMSPPMARPQTPPPSWPGRALGGALTNAEDWVRNAVLAALIEEISEFTAPPPAKGRKGVTPPAPSAPVPLQLAIAAVDAESAKANVAPARMPFPRP